MHTVPSSGLKRELGLLAVFSIASGAMISSGLFVLPGLAYEIAGPAMILSYGLASLLMIPTLLAKVEMCTAMPRSGGSYFFIERSMGPLFGTIAGFMHWLSIGLKSAFALVGIGTLTAGFFPGHEAWALKLTAALACLVLAGLNAFGTRETGRMQNVLVLALLLILGAYAVKGVPAMDGPATLRSTQGGWTAVFAVTGMVFVSYGGLTKVASVAEEVRNPTRNIPRGMFLAFGVVSLLYLLVIAATVGVLDGRLLSGSLTPIALGRKADHGTRRRGLRQDCRPAGLCDDRQLRVCFPPLALPWPWPATDSCPSGLSATHKRFGTPLASLGSPRCLSWSSSCS